MQIKIEAFDDSENGALQTAIAIPDSSRPFEQPASAVVNEEDLVVKRVVLRGDYGSSDSDSDSSPDSDSGSDSDFSYAPSSSESDDSDEELPTTIQSTAEVSGNDAFDRLVAKIRSHNGAHGDSEAVNGGLLSREWDFVIQETTSTRQQGKGGKRAYSGPVVSAHLRTLLGDGNQAYVDGELDKATRIMLEVIRIEPRTPTAWVVLAQCYEEKKQQSCALQLRIMAAHLRQDAEEWDRLAKQSKELGYPQQALYCWNKGHHVDPSNVAALWDCAMLAQSVNDMKSARFAFLGILSRFPHDLHIISLLRPILISLSDLQKCASLYNDAFDHHRLLFPSGNGPSTSSSEDVKPSQHVPGGGFGEMEVLVLADLFNELGEHERAIETVRRGIRWLQGRGEDNWWDLCTDDREYDPTGPVVNRVLDAINDVRPGFHPLNVNARHRLAVARLKIGDLEEGQVHAGMILAEEILDYGPLFTEIADAYFDVDQFAEARDIYEKLGSCEMTSNIHILTRAAICMRTMNDLHGAAEVYEAVRVADPDNNELKMELADIYEILDEPRKALDLVYEVVDSRRRRPREHQPEESIGATLSCVPGLIQERQKPPQPKTMSQMKHIRKPPRLLPDELRALEAEKDQESMEAYALIKQLWDGMQRGDEESTNAWLVEARKLVEMFRETRRLFTTSRVYRGMGPIRRTRKRLDQEDEDKILNRLQLDIAHQIGSHSQSGISNSFRGITIDEWLELFLQACLLHLSIFLILTVLQYSFVLTRQGDYDEAEEVLRHLLVSSAYKVPVYQDRIRIALMAVARFVGRLSVVVEQSRKIHTAHQFHNEPLRLLLATLGPSATLGVDACLGSPFQKYLHREVVIADAAVYRPAHVLWNTPIRRFSINPAISGDVVLGPEDVDEPLAGDLDGTKKPKQRLPDFCRKPNPVIIAIYGCTLLLSKSYQSSIYYLLMAHDLTPEDPLISLSLTAALLGRACQRQCDNRHHLVAEAMAFLARYREYRAGITDQHNSEIEYNVGRSFHHLGLYSHAVKHYERAIEAADPNDPTSCVSEAVYNLTLILVATGARQQAESLARRWLSV
ncbi:TPR-like protein [Mycena indigotica]|uniref:TPR-like protein n=1 Tax=Mycena indigotica TaxID=2126181 RepID=A0A8H6SET5_9AGAR|nr:TPR-like protein [Mycena indigotica]KAF7297042.1 TPR-like protein [Mycena indigotica]